MLMPGDLIELAGRVRWRFNLAPTFEFSIEIDPNDMTDDRYDAFAQAGVTRISVGVQDFNPVVQNAINRFQTFEQTEAVVVGMRRRGVTSVNLDVLYGLPHQTVASVVAPRSGRKAASVHSCRRAHLRRRLCCHRHRSLCQTVRRIGGRVQIRKSTPELPGLYDR